MQHVSCGVIVTDGMRLLLGHATRSPRWDIPKGLVNAGETTLDGALRELEEETGLVASPGALAGLGEHDYRPGKRLALFAWRVATLPDPARLVCRSRFATRAGESLPEFDRFGLFTWDEAATRIGRDLARLLAAARPALALRKCVAASP